MSKIVKLLFSTMLVLLISNFTFLSNGELIMEKNVKAAVSEEETTGGCAHSYSWVTTKAATCTTAGEKEQKCTRCGNVKSRQTIIPSGHPGSTAATCTEPARCIKCGTVLSAALGSAHTPGTAANCVYAQRCTKCNVVLKSPLGHNYTTIYESGSVDKHAKVEECTRCGKSTETIENHDFDANDKCTKCEYQKACAHNYAAATCTEAKKCTKCGTTTGAALGHNHTTRYESGSVDKHAKIIECTRCSYYAETIENHDFDANDKCKKCGYQKACAHNYAAATCTEAKKCTKCGTTTGAALGHSYKYTRVDDANHKITCTRCTFSQVSKHIFINDKCKVCNASKPQGVVASCTHTYVWNTIKSETCTTAGEKEQKCTSCGHVKSRQTIVPSGHPGSTAATCTEPARCIRCGATMKAASGHTLIIETTKVATCTTAGEQVEKCTKCTYVKSRKTIVPSGHPGSTAATCTEAARCIRCGEILTKALGHSLKIETTANATCTTAGEQVEKCTRCSYVKSRKTIAPSGHPGSTAATCTEAARCIRCGEILTNALGHSLKIETIVNATCTTAGEQVEKCIRCSYVKSRKTIAPSGHPGSTAATCTEPGRCIRCGAVLAKGAHTLKIETIIDATCTTAGEQVRKCTKCTYVESRKTIIPSGHPGSTAATCTEPARCIRCGDVLTKALGHNDEWIILNELQHRKDCRRCRIITQEPSNHRFENNVCIDCGYKRNQELPPKEDETFKKAEGIAWVNENTKENNIYEIKVEEIWNLIERVSVNPSDATVDLKFEFVETDPAKLKILKEKVDLLETGRLEAKELYPQGVELRVIDKLTNRQDKALFKVIEEIEIKPIPGVPLEVSCENGLLEAHKNLTAERVESDSRKHTKYVYCTVCNVDVAIYVEPHTGKQIEIINVSQEKHTKVMQCKDCNSKYTITEEHKYNTVGLCECGNVVATKEVALKSIDMGSSYTIKVGEMVDLSKKVTIKPSNATNVKLKYTIISGEDGVAQLGLYNGVLEAKKEAKNGIKIKVEDLATGINDTVVVKINKNNAIPENENVVPPTFEDVEDDSWYEEDVNNSVQDGIFNGTSENTFSPNGIVTRGMFVTVLARLEKANIDNFVNVFDDVREDAYYKESISWAVANGIVNGVGDGKFDPDAQITREAMAVIIYNYIKTLHQGLLQEVSNDSVRFADDAQIADWAKDAVYTLKTLGLANGKSNNNYVPKDTVTRAEAAVILQRLSDRIKSDAVEKEKCSVNKQISSHKNLIIQGLEKINEDKHKLVYACSECNTKWDGREEVHSFAYGHCKCGFECKHTGKTTKVEKYNNKQELIEQTICETCKQVIKEETKPQVQEPEKEPENEENKSDKPNYVMSEYSPSDFGQHKPKMTKDSYTDEDWDRMEAELKARVEKAGFGTRAGAVEAALYLASLDYAMPYRGTPMDRGANIGAYPKIGLNRTWGSYVKTTKEVTFNGNVYKKGYSAINGMDCGAFVAWAMVNGGVKPEGYAAGPGVSGYTNDKEVHISSNMISALGWNDYKGIHKLKDVADQIEPGDIALTYGYRNNGRGWTHIGLVVGVDDNNVYIAESTTGKLNKLVVTTVSKTYTGDVLGYIVLADDKLYTAKNADGTENKGNMPQVWGK